MGNIRIFDKSNDNWSNDLVNNEVFLRSIRSHALNVLSRDGHLFLNDVYKMLDLEVSVEGSERGWVVGSFGSGVLFEIDHVVDGYVLKFFYDDASILKALRTENQIAGYSAAIRVLRSSAHRTILESSDRKALLAASDLLEMHDKTSLNLTEAPRLKAFVEDLARITVEDNGA